MAEARARSTRLAIIVESSASMGVKWPSVREAYVEPLLRIYKDGPAALQTCLILYNPDTVLGDLACSPWTADIPDFRRLLDSCPAQLTHFGAGAAHSTGLMQALLRARALMGAGGPSAAAPDGQRWVDHILVAATAMADARLEVEAPDPEPPHHCVRRDMTLIELASRLHEDRIALSITCPRPRFYSFNALYCYAAGKGELGGTSSTPEWKELVHAHLFPLAFKSGMVTVLGPDVREAQRALTQERDRQARVAGEEASRVGRGGEAAGQLHVAATPPTAGLLAPPPPHGSQPQGGANEASAMAPVRPELSIVWTGSLFRDGMLPVARLTLHIRSRFLERFRSQAAVDAWGDSLWCTRTMGMETFKAMLQADSKLPNYKSLSTFQMPCTPESLPGMPPFHEVVARNEVWCCTNAAISKLVGTSMHNNRYGQPESGAVSLMLINKPSSQPGSTAGRWVGMLYPLVDGLRSG